MPGLPGFRRVPLGWRMISRDWLRFFLSVAGTGVTLSLMFFLVGVYDGVRQESNGYVAGRPVAAWVAQANATSLIRGTSFLNSAWREMVLTSPLAEFATPILKVVTTLQIRGARYTAVVCGIEPGATATRPDLAAGRADLQSGDIVVDRAFAARTGLAIGDVVTLQDHDFHVAGLSTGTNAVISQLVFLSLDDAQALLPANFRDVVSYIVVVARPGASPDALVTDLRARMPEFGIFTAAQFTENNLEELRTGLLPILSTLAIFGALVGATLLTLLLYGAILERREDYALLKAVGTSRGTLRLLVLEQGLLSVSWGLVLGLVIALAVRPVLARLVPILVVSFSWRAGWLIAAAALAMGALGAWLPLRRLERIYPAEVFRA